MHNFRVLGTIDPSVILPQPHVIVFDGVCNLCNATVAFVIRHDVNARFHFLPIQSELGTQLYAHLGHDPDRPGTLLLINEGEVLARSDAALGIARHLGWPWRMVAAARVLPRPWRDFVYDRVARSRYRFFGRQSACLVPTPALKARFLGNAGTVR